MSNSTPSDSEDLSEDEVHATFFFVDMAPANERDESITFNDETRLRWLGGSDQRVRSSLWVCVTKRIKHLAIRGNLKIISGGGSQLRLSFRTNILSK